MNEQYLGQICIKGAKSTVGLSLFSTDVQLTNHAEYWNWNSKGLLNKQNKNQNQNWIEFLSPYYLTDEEEAQNSSGFFMGATSYFDWMKIT